MLAASKKLPVDWQIQEEDSLTATAIHGTKSDPSTGGPPMPEVVYVPLDERPCNYKYPVRIAEESGQINLLVPPRDILGMKKRPADTGAVWEWLEKNIRTCSHAVISIDMLVYGGIVPSRLHHLRTEQCEQSLDRLRQLKKGCTKILAHNLIMRVPSYNSDDEEPDYYAKYGRDIFRYSWMQAKIDCHRSSTEENETLATLRSTIPSDILDEYMRRRQTNNYVNQQTMKLVQEGVIDFLVIPLDDCSEFGFSMSEQRGLLAYIENYGLQDRIYVYPGADEVGCTLVARVVNRTLSRIPRVYVRYSSIAGPALIPPFEDRPLGDSVKYQVIAAGGVCVDCPENADFILMVNAPAAEACGIVEASETKTGNGSAGKSLRNPREFVEAIRYYQGVGRKFAIADVAYHNGADGELMSMLWKQGLLKKTISYAGWNTAGNTLGTVIAHGMVRYSCEGASLFLLERLLEDWGYMTIARKQLESKTRDCGIDPLNLGGYERSMADSATIALNQFMDAYLNDSEGGYQVKEVRFPWHRLFEVDFHLCAAT